MSLCTTSLGGLAIVLGAAACGTSSGWTSPTPPSPTIASLYLTDASARRAALVDSLVNPENGYSQLRLAHYDSGDALDWSLLPESNPRAAAVAASELDGPHGATVGGALGPDARPITIDASALQGDPTALVALGREAFFHYPVEASLAAETATASRAAFTSYGFWVDDTLGAGGLVREETADGSSVFAFTCSTCHAATRDGSLVIGVGNDRIDLGRLTVEASSGADPVVAARLLSWGPGRLDVTTTVGLEPVRIGDVRPVTWLGFLQADATVAMRDIMTLAIRLETLIITSHNSADRPPRAITLGLAAYVLSLGTSVEAATPATDGARRGEALFETSCTGCHEPVTLTGAPVALDVIGTNPTIGLSLIRGTGKYRVPSLHGVSARRALLHDASLPTLEAMFDPSRLGEEYTGGRLGRGSVPGHVFGLELDAADRADLVEYLHTL